MLWAVRKGGGALPTVTSLTAQGITIMNLFVMQVTVGATHGATQDSVKKQSKYLMSHLQETENIS